MKNSGDKAAQAGGKAKKAYNPPKLEVFGNLGDITQGVGKSGKADGSISMPKGTAL